MQKAHKTDRSNQSLAGKKDVMTIKYRTCKFFFALAKSSGRSSEKELMLFGNRNRYFFRLAKNSSKKWQRTNFLRLKHEGLTFLEDRRKRWENCGHFLGLIIFYVSSDRRPQKSCGSEQYPIKSQQ